MEYQKKLLNIGVADSHCTLIEKNSDSSLVGLPQNICTARYDTAYKYYTSTCDIYTYGLKILPPYMLEEVESAVANESRNLPQVIMGQKLNCDNIKQSHSSFLTAIS